MNCSRGTWGKDLPSPLSSKAFDGLGLTAIEAIPPGTLYDNRDGWRRWYRIPQGTAKAEPDVTIRHRRRVQQDLRRLVGVHNYAIPIKCDRVEPSPEYRTFPLPFPLFLNRSIRSHRRRCRAGVFIEKFRSPVERFDLRKIE